MPYLKFDSPSGSSSNTGSIYLFINYLSKEDFRDNPLSKEFFFNNESSEILDSFVVDAIDCNRKGLTRNDAKFYTGSINFSEQELQFIENDSNRIKEYSIKVMEQYASNFNRGVSIDNINWFGKIEYKRYFKGDDEETINGIVTQGEIKPGLNTHVHFLVGRKSKDQRFKLSPKTNHRNTQKGPIKGGFNRDVFKMQCEKIFDEMFGYLRPLEESYQFYKIKANGNVDEKVILSNQRANETVKKESYLSQSIDKKEVRISKLANFICHGANREITKQINIDEIINFEKITQHRGYVYQSLVNLNRMIKQGKTPEGYDLTNNIIEYAKFLAEKDLKIGNYNGLKHERPIVQSNLDVKIVNEKSNTKKRGTKEALTSIIPTHKKKKNRGFDWIEGYEF